LIRRFLDPGASFVFVEELEDVPAEATPFDIRGAELSHRNGNCTFETLLEEYGLEDPALRAIGRIVHEADLDDARFDAPEAPGLDAIVRGLSLVSGDEELLERARPIFDGLYELSR
jgi:hypothetical protein